MQGESQELLVRRQRRTVNWSGLGIDVNRDAVREHPYDPVWYFNTSAKEWERRLGVREAAGAS